jgi:hypothetical protein
MSLCPPNTIRGGFYGSKIETTLKEIEELLAKLETIEAAHQQEAGALH